MKQYNCKNCGAPVKHTYNHRCEYCNSILDFNVSEKDIVKVNPEDLIDLQLVDIERVPEFYGLRFMFTGFKCVRPTIYEFDGENNYVSSVIEYRNPPKCGFIIDMSFDEIERCGIDYVMHRIMATGVHPREIEKIKYQVIERLGGFCRINY